MKINIKTLSELTGFSQATVSNALHNKRGVNRETAEKILKAAREIGYFSDARISSIRLVVYQSTGGVVGDTPFFASLIAGVEAEAREFGYDTRVYHLSKSAPDYDQRMEKLCSDLSCGLLVLATELELEEAARIDGCSVYRTYFSVVLPLLRPAMATLVIMQAFQIWNDYLLASLYVSKNDLKTLTVSIQSLFSAQSNDYTTAMAAIVISVLPIVILFLALQKYFIKGMTVGAVKG